MINWNVVAQIFGWPIMLSGMLILYIVINTMKKVSVPSKIFVKIILWTCFGVALIWGIR